MAVDAPDYATVKANIVTILKAVATAENAVSTGRNFQVVRDMSQSWISSQQNKALVNVRLDSINPEGGGTRHFTQDRVSFYIDLYVLGTAEEQTDEATGDVTLFPADQEAADRLDLLVAQVRYGITKMSTEALGMTVGQCDSHALKARLQIYDQDGSQDTGCYAPARFSFDVSIPYNPADDGPTVAVSEINVKFDESIEKWSLKYVYGD